MLTLERLMEEIELWHASVSVHCGDVQYYNDVAGVWFNEIAPDRAPRYGVLGFNELGVPGILAQTFNCYYRWATGEADNRSLRDQADVLLDVFGFAVLTAIVHAFNPDDAIQYNFWSPSHIPLALYEVLKRGAWLNGDLRNVVADSFALAYNMHRVTLQRVAS